MTDPNQINAVKLEVRGRGFFQEVADALGLGAVEDYWRRECGAQTDGHQDVVIHIPRFEGVEGL